MKKIIKAAVLGMGNMGKAHGENILRMENVELAALCSSHRESAEEFAEKNKVNCPIYEDAYKMIEEVPMDVLYICIPPFAHNGQFEAAADKGIHIFIEKPIAIDLDRGKSMAAAAERNHVLTQVGYHMRFGLAVKRFKELLDLGTAGRPTLFTAEYECNSLHGEWWRDVKKCGGQVFEQIIHLYDMGMYFCGKPEAVSGYVANLCHGQVEGYTVEDTSISNIVFSNGALGSITGSNCAVKNQWNGRFRMVCEHMTAYFTDFNHAEFVFTGSDEARREVISGNVDAIFEEDCYFMEVVRGNKRPVADIGEGLEGLRMVSGVVESSKEEGKAVRLHESLTII